MIEPCEILEQKILQAREFRELVEIEEKLKRLLEMARTQERKLEKSHKKTPKSHLLSPLA